MEAIENPKIRGAGSFSSTGYRFYPSFSERFARSALSSAGLREGEWVLDLGTVAVQQRRQPTLWV
jgi:hypothetical protein